MEPVFVLDPAGHSVHASVLELVEYQPGAQGVQLVAPAALPVLVMEPAWHMSQLVRPLEGPYSPDTQLTHATAILDPPVSSPYNPAAHSMHAEADAAPLAVAYLPAVHVMQSEAATEPIVATDLTAVHGMHAAELLEPSASTYVPATH